MRVPSGTIIVKNVVLILSLVVALYSNLEGVTGDEGTCQSPETSSNGQDEFYRVS